jgi:HSP20 family molecular chaperone IbpA
MLIMTNHPPNAMKTSFPKQYPLRHPTLAIIGLLLGATPAMRQAAAADEPAAKHHMDLLEKTRRMRDEMSRKFHHTWQELRDSVEAGRRSMNPASSASVDLREQNDGYMLRLYLPGRDVEKMEVTLADGKRLHIMAPAGHKAGLYEQSITLEGLAADAKPRVERNQKQHLVIIHIPKAASTVKPVPETGKAPPEALPPPIDRRDIDLLERMDRMRREMDRIFRDNFDELGGLPDVGELFDEARFGSSVELREEGDNYVIRSYLPDRDAKNVKVAIEDGRILKVDAVAEDSSSEEEGRFMMQHKAQYSQRITLPGPVDEAKLKVDRKKDMLIITVPKIMKDKMEESGLRIR